MTDVDGELAKLLGAQNAEAQQALSGSVALADMLVAFRVRLIIGGFTPEDAADFAREYFGAILDRLGASTDDTSEDEQ